MMSRGDDLRDFPGTWKLRNPTDQKKLCSFVFREYIRRSCLAIWSYRFLIGDVEQFKTGMHRHRWEILVIHRKTFDGAYFHTGITHDTPETVNLPCFLLRLDTNGLCRALFHANLAGNTFTDINHDMPTGDGRLFCRLYGVHECCRSVDNAFCHGFRHFKQSHLYHLSEHPIHGSIEWTITGTSASSHPFSMTIRGGILVNVGVLTLERTRFFVPFPFT